MKLVDYRRCVFNVEPTSSSAPRMIAHAFILGQIEGRGSSFSLSCAAQSFPAPTFRYTSDIPSVPETMPLAGRATEPSNHSVSVSIS